MLTIFRETYIIQYLAGKNIESNIVLTFTKGKLTKTEKGLKRYPNI